MGVSGAQQCGLLRWQDRPFAHCQLATSLDTNTSNGLCRGAIDPPGGLASTPASPMDERLRGVLGVWHHLQHGHHVGWRVQIIIQVGAEELEAPGPLEGARQSLVVGARKPVRSAVLCTKWVWAAGWSSGYGCVDAWAWSCAGPGWIDMKGNQGRTNFSAAEVVKALSATGAQQEQAFMSGENPYSHRGIPQLI